MQELPFLHSASRLMLIDICMKFREDSLRGFQVTERTRFDRQTDRQTDARGKTICLPTLKGGDIIHLHKYKPLQSSIDLVSVLLPFNMFQVISA